jgi:hypothetical protein
LVQDGKAMSDYTYESFRRVVYGDGATFIPVCPRCGRFVKTPDAITFGYLGQPVGPTATCSKCGPVDMPFEGYVP